MAQAAEAVGASDEAYAASGVDLSFGSAARARTEVYRGLDLGLNTDTGTTATRLTRLDERGAQLPRHGEGRETLGRVGRLLQGCRHVPSRCPQQA